MIDNVLKKMLICLKIKVFFEILGFKVIVIYDMVEGIVEFYYKWFCFFVS